MQQLHHQQRVPATIAAPGGPSAARCLQRSAAEARTAVQHRPKQRSAAVRAGRIRTDRQKKSGSMHHRAADTIYE
jgi:hypothetical protein